MFTVTKAAATEIRRSMDLSDADGMGLRLAASRGDDGGVHYKMGFDERAPGDLVIQTNGVEVLIASAQRTLVDGATMDFVDVGSGAMDFIFLNPNDPHFRPPEQSADDLVAAARKTPDQTTAHQLAPDQTMPGKT